MVVFDAHVIAWGARQGASLEAGDVRLAGGIWYVLLMHIGCRLFFSFLDLYGEYLIVSYDSEV